MSESGKILAVDDNAALPRRFTHVRVPVWAMIGTAAALIGFAGFAAYGFRENGLRLGNELAWRFTCLVFFAALVAGPASRLMPWAWLRRVGEERHQLVWGFCASVGVFIATLIIPNATTPSSVEHEGLTLGMALFAIFGGVLTAVIAYVAVPKPQLGEQSRKAMLGVGISYFWLAYTLTGLSHLSGPHRPDAFYGISLVLMLAALLLRFADRFVAKNRAPRDAAQS